MRRFTYTLALPLLVAALGAFDTAGTVHLRMTKSIPAKDTVLSSSPTEIRLWFNQVPQLAVSRINLDGPTGAIAVGDVESTDDEKSFRAALNGPLTEGSYSVSWRTAGDDGHVIRRSFGFSIRASAVGDRR